jgi:hypothetical protein
MDITGKIKATAYNEHVAKLYSLLKVDKVKIRLLITSNFFSKIILFLIERYTMYQMAQ